jgi:hypothetical protein
VRRDRLEVGAVEEMISIVTEKALTVERQTVLELGFLITFTGFGCVNPGTLWSQVR